MIDKRSVSRKDASLLAALDARCFAYEAWSQDQFEGSLALPTTRGQALWEQRTLVGFYLIQCVADETEILTICVDPAHRRCGYGRTMIRDILAQQQSGAVFLEVAQDNEAARALYESCGFCLSGRRPGYYRRGNKRIDALTYRYLVKT